MTIVELQWIIGTAVSVVIAMMMIDVGSFRAMGNKLENAVRQLETFMKTGDDNLHERVNRLRQDVSDNYVRRIDLDGHLRRIDDTMKQILLDQKELIRNVTLLTASSGEVRKRRQPPAASS